MSDDEEEGGGDEGAPAWMATFADMMSLLLTFFVLILSFANMDVIKFSAAVDSLHDAFGTIDLDTGDQEARSDALISLADSARPQLIALDNGAGERSAPNLRREVEAMVKRLQLDKLVEVDESERGVVIRVVGHLLFDPGSVELRPESHVLLREIATLMTAVPAPVSIEGHTDATAAGSADVHGIPSERAETSNWHLSAGRAISVVQHLERVHRIDAARMSAAGFAHTRPVAPNDSPESRSLNRRVEFVFQHEAAPLRTARRD